MPDIRVQDEQGNTHVFPDGSTPEMISQAMGLKPRPDFAANPPAVQPPNVPVNANVQTPALRGPSYEMTPEQVRNAGLMAGMAAAAPLTGGLSTLGAVGVMGGGAAAGSALGQLASAGSVDPNTTGKAAVEGGAAELGGRALGAVPKLAKGLIVSDTAKAAAAAKETIVPKVSQALHGALDQTAKDAGVAIPAETSASKKAASIAHDIQGKAQDIYKGLDELSGGRYQRFRDKIDGLNEVIYNKHAIDPTAVQSARAQLTEVQAEYAKAQSQLVQEGVDPKVIRQADDLWKQKSALQDVAKKLQNAEDLSGQLHPSRSVGSLDTGLKKLGSSRLDQALGKNAIGVRQSVIDAGRAASAAKTGAKEIETVRGRRKTAAIAGAAALGIGGAASQAGKIGKLLGGK